MELIAPLSSLENFAGTLRTISSGTASLTMEPHGYSLMSVHDEEIAIRKSHGLE